MLWLWSGIFLKFVLLFEKVATTCLKKFSRKHICVVDLSVLSGLAYTL